MDFSTLKKNRGNTENLTKELEKLSAKQNNQDDNDNFWQPVVDKAGNGQAVIRFLPPPEGEDNPIIRYWDHGFQGPGGWYIEKSLTSIGQVDPCSELNAKLWNSGNEADKEQVRKQKRKLHFVSNIFIIRDPAAPDNEGKVFLFRYGKKIFDKINDMLNPSFEGDAKINPFDFWEGASFRLRIRNVEGYRNYDKSEFENSAPLSNDDAVLEKIWKQQHSLQQFLDASKFKSYDELKTRLNKVLGVSETRTTTPAAKPVPATATTNTPPWQEDVRQLADDADDDVSYFRKLAAG